MTYKIGEKVRVKTCDGWFDAVVSVTSEHAIKVQSAWRERLRGKILDIVKADKSPEYTTEQLMASYR